MSPANKKSLNDPPETKPVKSKSVFRSTVSKSLGVSLGILIFICGLVAIIYILIIAHDKFLSRQFESPPSYSKDNQWGGLGVNIVIDKKEIKEPVADKIKDCNSPGEKSLAEFRNRFGIGYACVDGLRYGGDAGSVYLEGTINVKNNLWLETKIIPTNLLTFNHGGRQVKPKLDKNIFGQYLNHGQGTSTRFSFSEAYDAKDFQLYLNDGTKSALIVGDTIEPEHK